MGGRGLLPIGAGDGEGFEALMDCDGGMFENSEGIVVGKDHVPGGSGVGHEGGGGGGHGGGN